jgi:hypothetical protein
MTVYVAEIDGRVIAALDAEDQSAAEEWFKGEEFLEDVCSSFEDEENRPLWDENSEIMFDKQSERRPRRGKNRTQKPFSKTKSTKTTNGLSF